MLHVSYDTFTTPVRVVHTHAACAKRLWIEPFVEFFATVCVVLVPSLNGFKGFFDKFMGGSTNGYYVMTADSTFSGNMPLIRVAEEQWLEVCLSLLPPTLQRQLVDHCGKQNAELKWDCSLIQQHFSCVEFLIKCILTVLDV